MNRHALSPVSCVLVATAALLAGCATHRSACAPCEQAMINEWIYFGMAKPAGGVVTAEEWDDFLRTFVTPRFPAGLSAWPASGQWRGADGRVVREDSRVLNVLHPADAPSELAIRAIVAEYGKRFAQEAVLRVRSDACATL